MNQPETELIRIRLEKAEKTYQAAKLMAQHNHWISCVNRLYYSCFYAASALLLKSGFTAKTHNGVKSIFNQQFIKTKQFPLEYVKLFTDLFDMRTTGEMICTK